MGGFEGNLGYHCSVESYLRITFEIVEFPNDRISIVLVIQIIHVKVPSKLIERKEKYLSLGIFHISASYT